MAQQRHGGDGAERRAVPQAGAAPAAPTLPTPVPAAPNALSMAWDRPGPAVPETGKIRLARADVESSSFPPLFSHAEPKPCGPKQFCL